MNSLPYTVHASYKFLITHYPMPCHPTQDNVDEWLQRGEAYMEST